MEDNANFENSFGIMDDDFPYTPLTDETFERQEWEMKVGIEKTIDGESEEFYYWVLPLPKDNPDENALCLVSSANIDYHDFGLKKGEYLVQLDGYYGIGVCLSEEDLEILYRALTKSEIE